MKCPYCKKQDGVLMVSCDFGLVEICLECAREQQERLGIKENYITEIENGN